MQIPVLDDIDRRILTALQENARISNVELAELVGVSPSPCWRRVRDLETLVLRLQADNDRLAAAERDAREAARAAEDLQPA